MAQAQKPVPRITEMTRPYWEAAKKHELVLMQCSECGQYRHPLSAPQEFICPNCTSTKKPQWARVSGRGKLLTWTVVHRVFHPSFADEAPYTVALARLDEGPRMLANLRGVKPEDIKPDMEVEVFFEELAPEITLPQFRPVSAGS